MGRLTIFPLNSLHLEIFLSILFLMVNSLFSFLVFVGWEYENCLNYIWRNCNKEIYLHGFSWFALLKHVGWPEFGFSSDQKLSKSFVFPSIWKTSDSSHSPAPALRRAGTVREEHRARGVWLCRFGLGDCAGAMGSPMEAGARAQPPLILPSVALGASSAAAWASGHPAGG